jgi:Cu/Ag efflux pump CusA
MAQKNQKEPKEITMSRLKSALVAAIGTVAIAGFAMALAGPAAMAAASKQTVPTGSVRFTVDSVPQRSVSQGARMSAGQKKQWMLLPAVQKVRERAGRGNGDTQPKPRGPEDCMSCAN